MTGRAGAWTLSLVSALQMLQSPPLPSALVHCSLFLASFQSVHPSGSSLEYVAFCQPFPAVSGRINHSHVCVSLVFRYKTCSFIVRSLSAGGDLPKTVSKSSAPQLLSRQALGPCMGHRRSLGLPAQHSTTEGCPLPRPKKDNNTLSSHLLGMK